MPLVLLNLSGLFQRFLPSLFHELIFEFYALLRLILLHFFFRLRCIFDNRICLSAFRRRLLGDMLFTPFILSYIKLVRI